MLSNDSPLKVTVAQFLPKLQDVLLKAFNLPHLPSLQIPLDVLQVDLVDSQLAEVDLGSIEDVFSVLYVDLPKAIGPQLYFAHTVFVLFIEDCMEDLLGFDISFDIFVPNVPSSFLVEFLFFLKTGHNNYFLECIV